MPRSAQLTIGNYRFDLPERNAHTVSDVDLGPTGEVAFSLDDWAAGHQTIEQGLKFNKAFPGYVSARGVDAAFPGQLILQPLATTVSVASGAPALASPFKQVDFTVGGSTNTYLIQEGTTVHYLNYDSPRAWTAVASLNTHNATDAVVHGGAIPVSFGHGHKYTSTGTVFTSVPSTATDRLGVLGQNIWRSDNPNTLYSASAINGTWSSAYTVADSSFNVNSIVVLEQVLMVAKEDGIYSIDAEGVVTPFTPELRTQANTDFADVSAATTFNGDYYFRTLNGLVMISGSDGSKRRVGLDQLVSPDIPTPVVRALTADDRFLYAICDNSSNDLMILRRNIYGAWHTFYWDGSAGTKRGRHVAISSALGYPALFFSYYDGSSTYTTKQIRLSTFPNPRQDTNYRYDTSSTLRLRLPRFSSPDTPVVFDRVLIQSDNLTSDITITPYYSADGGSVTQFGSSAATSSPLTSISAGTPVTGHHFDLWLEMVTNDSTIT